LIAKIITSRQRGGDKMFYAGYDEISPDIAVFETEEERDAWVNDKDAMFPRVVFDDGDIGFFEDEANSTIDTWEEDDANFWGVRWKINPVNK
jgi:hypothetical protein